MLNKKNTEAAAIAVSSARNNPVYAAEAKSDNCLDLLRVAAVHAVADLNSVQAQDAPTAAALSAAVETANTAVNNYNTMAVVERLNALVTMSDADAFSAYMADQNVDGLTVSTNDTGVSYLDAKKVKVSAYDFMAYKRPEELAGVINACIIFADNCARLRTNSTGDGSTITRAVIPTKYAEIRDRLGWTVDDDKLSRTVLVGHLNDLVNKFLMPRGQSIKMLKADFRFVNDSLFRTVDKANSAGVYQTRNNETILNFIFRALYTRYNGLPYEWQQAKSDKDAPADKAASAEKKDDEKGTTAKKSPAKKAAAKKTAATAKADK